MNYIVYKITNKINNKIYIGCHKTENINDDYMGSGTLIRRAIGKYGLENFEKIVLYNFDNKLDMLKKEAELVNREFIKRNDVYNLVEGGGGGWQTGFVSVRDENNCVFVISINDPNYLSGKYKGMNTGKCVVRDNSGKVFMVQKNDPNYLSGVYKSIMIGKVPVKTADGVNMQVAIDDPRYISGELKYILKGLATMKDKDGNYFNVSVDDPRIKTGELIGTWKGNHHTEETKRRIGEKNKIKQRGIGNSQYNKIWIYNSELKENKKIKNEELNIWIERGWIKGRKMKFN